MENSSTLTSLDQPPPQPADEIRRERRFAVSQAILLLVTFLPVAAFSGLHIAWSWPRILKPYSQITLLQKILLVSQCMDLMILLSLILAILVGHSRRRGMMKFLVFVQAIAALIEASFWITSRLAARSRGATLVEPFLVELFAMICFAIGKRVPTLAILIYTLRPSISRPKFLRLAILAIAIGNALVLGAVIHGQAWVEFRDFVANPLNLMKVSSATRSIVVVIWALALGYFALWAKNASAIQLTNRMWGIVLAALLASIVFAVTSTVYWSYWTTSRKLFDKIAFVLQDCLILCAPLLTLSCLVLCRYGLLPGEDSITLNCGNCGYNLTANTTGICPECGAPISATIQDPKSQI